MLNMITGLKWTPIFERFDPNSYNCIVFFEHHLNICNEDFIFFLDTNKVRVFENVLFSIRVHISCINLHTKVKFA